MVTTAVFEEAAVLEEAKWPVEEVLTSRPSQCARCGSRMFMGREEPECTTCGYADYTYSRDMAPRWARNSILSSATRLVARYVGASERLAHTVVHMTLVRRGTRAIYKVTCPVLPGLDGGVVPVGQAVRATGTEVQVRRRPPRVDHPRQKRDAGLDLGQASMHTRGETAPVLTSARSGTPVAVCPINKGFDGSSS